jgi:hypothetical protein
MSLGIYSRSFKHSLPGKATLIDGVPIFIDPGKKYYVDGDISNGGDGASWETAFSGIDDALTQAVVDIVSPYVPPTIFVKARKISAGGTDPVSYSDALTIPATLPGLRLIGVGNGQAQGHLPQIKVGSGSSPLLTVKAPGVYIARLGFNGASSTGGGIKLSDDGSTYTSFGAVIEDCHFKNCVGSTATSSTTGGAIQLSGAPWQVLIRNCRFYKNVGGIVLLDTSNSVPQDVVIMDNIFSGPPASVDSFINGLGGSGFGTGLVIKGNVFDALPAIGSGAVVRFMDLTGADGGIVAENYFGTSTVNAFGASGSQAKIPTSVFVVGNWGQSATGVTIS